MYHEGKEVCANHLQGGHERSTEGVSISLLYISTDQNKQEVHANDDHRDDEYM